MAVKGLKKLRGHLIFRNAGYGQEEAVHPDPYRRGFHTLQGKEGGGQSTSTAGYAAVAVRAGGSNGRSHR
jgi:hypothetical protein